jgi:hypothetical protein
LVVTEAGGDFSFISRKKKIEFASGPGPNLSGIFLAELISAMASARPGKPGMDTTLLLDSVEHSWQALDVEEVLAKWLSQFSRPQGFGWRE